MSLKYRRQTALLWSIRGYDVDSKPVYDAPREIKVRWIIAEQSVRKATGELTKIAAIAILGEDVIVGSLMWLGTTDDWESIEGIGPAKVCEVIGFKKVSDPRNRFHHREAQLAFYEGYLGVPDV